MNTFINDIINNIAKSYVIKNKSDKFNYFDIYQRCFSDLEEDEQIKVYNTIEKNIEIIDSSTRRDILTFLSYDMSNNSVKLNNIHIRNYIIFCIYCYILEGKIEHLYFNDKNILHLDYKDRPHRFLGTVYEYNSNDFVCNVFGVNFDQTKPFKSMITKIERLKEENMIIPYCGRYDNIVVYEKLDPLEPRRDPLITVLKDVVNQLKNINKYYWFEYITCDAIGRSNVNFKRYYINFFDSLVEKNKKISSFNVYDGREEYTKISSKDQIRTVLHVLSELYVTGKDSYKEKCKFEPFKSYLEHLETLNLNNCYDQFIYYLMGIKI